MNKTAARFLGDNSLHTPMNNIYVVPNFIKLHIKIYGQAMLLILKLP